MAQADTASEHDQALVARFEQLAANWREERQFLSSSTQMAMCPSYQQIIGMGRDALPLIFHELAKEPDHWFWALKSITGEDPVPVEQRGMIREMTRAWLHWAREHGYEGPSRP